MTVSAQRCFLPRRGIPAAFRPRAAEPVNSYVNDSTSYFENAQRNGDAALGDENRAAIFPCNTILFFFASLSEINIVSINCVRLFATIRISYVLTSWRKRASFEKQVIFTFDYILSITWTLYLNNNETFCVSTSNVRVILISTDRGNIIWWNLWECKSNDINEKETRISIERTDE